MGAQPLAQPVENVSPEYSEIHISFDEEPDHSGESREEKRLHLEAARAPMSASSRIQKGGDPCYVCKEILVPNSRHKLLQRAASMVDV